MGLLGLFLIVTFVGLSQSSYWYYPPPPPPPPPPHPIVFLQDKVEYECSCDPCNKSPCFGLNQECRIIVNSDDPQDPALMTECVPDEQQIVDPVGTNDGFNPCPVGDPAVIQVASLFLTVQCVDDSGCPPPLMCVGEGVCCLRTNDCQKIGLCPGGAISCGASCSKDSDCSGIAKCCSYTNCGGKVCMYPLTT